MKYLKRAYIMNTVYMKVNEKDNMFYKGFAIGFDISETKVESIHTEMWLDYKSCGYLISEISKKEFDEKFNTAIKYLKTI